MKDNSVFFFSEKKKYVIILIVKELSLIKFDWLKSGVDEFILIGWNLLVMIFDKCKFKMIRKLL